MPTDLNFSAYYYAFEPTGSRIVDVMLSAVARAGKAFHHTEDWGNEIEPYHPEFEGNAPVDWIQNAAVRAAKRIAVLEDLLDRCAELLDSYVDVVDGDDGQPEPNKAMRLVSEIREVVPA